MGVYSIRRISGVFSWYYAAFHLPRKLEFRARSDILLVLYYGYRCVPAVVLCLYASCREPNSDRQMATWWHLVDEMNICHPNTQWWVTFIIAINDWDTKAIIQESYILLTLFAELLYIEMIKMCKHTKTIKEKGSNEQKILLWHSFTSEKYFFPKGRVKRKCTLVEGIVFYFRAFKNPAVTPHFK